MLTSKDQRGLRAVVESHTKDTADVFRQQLSTGNGDCYEYCLTTSRSEDEVSPFGFGLFQCNSDEITINYIHMKGLVSLDCERLVDHTALPGNFFRLIVVWYHKPDALPQADGAECPHILEVIPTFQRSTAAMEMPLSETNARGKFTILHDSTVALGLNASASTLEGAVAPLVGQNRQIFEYKIPVNKTMHFALPCTTASIVGFPGYGGHFDSDEAAGQVTTGMIMAYFIAAGSSGYRMFWQCNTRINYTG